MPAMHLTHRPALPGDAPACIDLRGRTRQNAISAAQLAAWGITATSWAEGIRSGATPGHVALQGDALIGYCFGDRGSGEVLVLALLPKAEGLGLGRELLARVVHQLRGLGHLRLFLGCSTDPASRSHGFYRHLGWQPTGRLDAHGDEILELDRDPAPGPAGAVQARL
jgi:GNAT superfamily N-acetyltransferase